MTGKILLAVGLTILSVGFGFLGIATSTYQDIDRIFNASYIMMGFGLVASVIGYLLYRAGERQY